MNFIGVLIKKIDHWLLDGCGGGFLGGKAVNIIDERIKANGLLLKQHVFVTPSSALPEMAEAAKQAHLA